MRQILWIAGISAMLTAMPVLAAVTIESRIAQQGMFREANCDPSYETDAYNECLCQAEVKYPQVTSGTQTPLFASRINTRLELLAPNVMCEGNPTEEKTEVSTNGVTGEYQVTLNDGPYLSVLQTNHNMNAGAAHSVARLESANFRLPEGELVTMAKVVDTAKLPELNAYIYEQIISGTYDGTLKQEDYWWRVLQEKKDKFVSASGCNECVFYLGEKQPAVAFQLYSVAAYAVGIVEIPIPLEFIADEGLRAYYEGQQ